MNVNRYCLDLNQHLQMAGTTVPSIMKCKCSAGGCADCLSQMCHPHI